MSDPSRSLFSLSGREVAMELLRQQCGLTIVDPSEVVLSLTPTANTSVVTIRARERSKKEGQGSFQGQTQIQWEKLDTRALFPSDLVYSGSYPATFRQIRDQLFATHALWLEEYEWSSTPDGAPLALEDRLEATPDAQARIWLYASEQSWRWQSNAPVALTLSTRVVREALSVPKALSWSVEVEQPFQSLLTVKGGTAPYHYALTLPTGLKAGAVVVDGNGRLSGSVPAGQWPLTVVVSDSQGQSATSVVTLQAILNPLSLPAPTVSQLSGMPLAVTLRPAGGVAPYQLMLNNPPWGVALAQVGGSPTLTGVPAPGQHAITLDMQDARQNRLQVTGWIRIQKRDQEQLKTAIQDRMRTGGSWWRFHDQVAGTVPDRMSRAPLRQNGPGTWRTDSALSFQNDQSLSLIGRLSGKIDQPLLPLLRLYWIDRELVFRVGPRGHELLVQYTSPNVAWEISSAFSILTPTGTDFSLVQIGSRQRLQVGTEVLYFTQPAISLTQLQLNAGPGKEEAWAEYDYLLACPYAMPLDLIESIQQSPDSLYSSL